MKKPMFDIGEKVLYDGEPHTVEKTDGTKSWIGGKMEMCLIRRADGRGRWVFTRMLERYCIFREIT